MSRSAYSDQLERKRRNDDLLKPLALIHADPRENMVTTGARKLTLRLALSGDPRRWVRLMRQAGVLRSQPAPMLRLHGR